MKQKVISFGGPRRPPPATRAQAAAAASARRKRRRTGRHTLHYLLILLVAAAIMAILSLTVFFQIEQVTVTGNTRYADEELLDASGVKVGDNLFRVSERGVSKRLQEKYAYIEGVKLKRGFPPRLTIGIQQAVPLGAVDTAAGYVVIGRSGRVLELGASAPPPDTMIVTGMYLYNPKERQVLGAGYAKEEQAQADKEADGFDMLLRLVDAVEETGFENITMVDFSDSLNMVMVYENRILIELGVQSDLPYKLRFIRRVIEDELEPNFQGTLDASLAASSREIWRTPGDISQELEKRRVTAAEQAAAVERPQAAFTPPAGANPDLEVVPGTAPVKAPAPDAASGSSSKGSEKEPEAAPSPTPAPINELEVIPAESSSSPAGPTPAPEA